MRFRKNSHASVIFRLRGKGAGRKSPLTEAEEKRKRGTEATEAVAKTTVTTIWRQDGSYARGSGVLR